MANPVIVAPPKTINYDDLMALGSDVRVEVINGEILEMSPNGGNHNFGAGNIYDAFKVCTKRDKIGLAATDGLIYLMGFKKAHLRDSFVPDASFVAKQYVPEDWDSDEPFPGVPTIAVEVISPNDDREKLSLKVQRYFELGTDEVWVLDKIAKALYQHFRNPPGTVRVYHEPTERIETPLLPTLNLTMADVFAPPTWL